MKGFDPKVANSCMRTLVKLWSPTALVMFSLPQAARSSVVPSGALRAALAAKQQSKMKRTSHGDLSSIGWSKYQLSVALVWLLLLHSVS